VCHGLPFGVTIEQVVTGVGLVLGDREGCKSLCPLAYDHMPGLGRHLAIPSPEPLLRGAHGLISGQLTTVVLRSTTGADGPCVPVIIERRERSPLTKPPPLSAATDRPDGAD